MSAQNEQDTILDLFLGEVAIDDFLHKKYMYSVS